MNALHFAGELAGPWNKGRLIGQKLPLKRKEIWAIRIRLQIDHRIRDLALFNLAIDNKLRGCDLVKPHVGDIALGMRIPPRATVLQQKTHRPVQFEITEQTRASITAWIDKAHLSARDYCSRVVSRKEITSQLGNMRGPSLPGLHRSD